MTLAVHFFWLGLVLQTGQSEAKLVGRFNLPTDNVRGVSGAAIDVNGLFYAIPERIPVLLQADLSRWPQISPVKKIPITGIPPKLDTESLAFVEPGLWAIGTERNISNRTQDDILLLSYKGTTAQIVGNLVLDYSRFGILAKANHGIEGLCSADGVILAALETAVKEKGPRFAAVFRYSLATEIWEMFKVRLQSANGKISTLACQRRQKELYVLAIERHYEVILLVSFSIPLDGPGLEIRPVVLANLEKLIPRFANPEAIEWIAPNRIALIVDNDYGGVTGPNEVAIVELPR